MQLRNIFFPAISVDYLSNKLF